MLAERAEKMLTALRSARDDLGRWPIAVEWEASGRRQSRRTLVRQLGSWIEASWAAERASIGDCG
jgi:hypothetical protein